MHCELGSDIITLQDDDQPSRLKNIYDNSKRGDAGGEDGLRPKPTNPYPESDDDVIHIYKCV